ncbi:hypothetical protein ACFOU0_06165 [Salinicoccus sesuvii]|uniref:Uncharacterized protein n=1 Tax=Salinicoccus sesuvii TaxID=868281 RepID=A0ABV7N3I8_9STAP
MRLYDHGNYTIYKQVRQDMLDGRAMLHDKVYINREGKSVFGYSHHTPRIFCDEEMTVRELLELLGVNKRSIKDAPWTKRRYK